MAELKKWGAIFLLKNCLPLDYFASRILVWQGDKFFQSELIFRLDHVYICWVITFPFSKNDDVL